MTAACLKFTESRHFTKNVPSQLTETVALLVVFGSSVYPLATDTAEKPLASFPLLPPPPILLLFLILRFLITMIINTPSPILYALHGSPIAYGIVGSSFETFSGHSV